MSKDWRLAATRSAPDPSTYLVDGIECRRIPLTQWQYSLVEAADYEWLMEWHWYARWHKMQKSFYACRTPRGARGQTQIQMHRFIAGVTDPKIKVDHPDHDTLDNRRSRLRPCTNSQNCMNQKRRFNSSSGFKGVTWDERRGLWVVRIHVNGKVAFRSAAPSAKEAGAIYDSEVAKIHGQFALPNRSMP